MHFPKSPGWNQVKTTVPSAATLVFLLALAVWGHVSHWQFAHGDSSAHGGHADASPGLEAGGSSSDEIIVSDPAATPGEPSKQPLTRVCFRSPQAVQKCGIQTVPVVERSIDEGIVANGVISYDQTRVAQLAARVPGTVWRIEKQLGQPIKKGDVLAVIEAPEVGQAKAELMQAVVLYQLKKGIADRLESKQSFIPDRQIFEAQSEAREAFIRMATTQQRLINLGLPMHEEDFTKVPDDQLAGRIQFLGLPASITKSIDGGAATMSLVPLVAPFDGVVIGHDISLGEVVSPSAQQFVIADISKMWIRMDVRKEDAARLSLGLPVVFITDGGRTEVASTISWISSEIDQKTRTIPVRAEVENPLAEDGTIQGQERHLLLANSFGTGRIRVREIPKACVVPRDAVQWEGNHWVVFVQVDDTTFEARPVELGISLQDLIEINEGVVPGDIVAGSGSHLLKSEILRSRAVAGPGAAG